MKEKNSLLETSAISILGGVGISVIYPPFAPIAIMLKAGGVFGLGYYGLTMSKFDKIFKNINFGFDDVYPIQKSVKHGEYSTVYKFTLPHGKSVDDLKNKKLAIEQMLGKKIEIEYINSGLFIIEVYHDSSSKMYDYDEIIEIDGDIAFPIGYDLHQKLITCCLSTGDDNAHMLIAGTSGGGKSILLKVILTYLITHKNVDMYLIDLKGTELSIYENCECVKEIGYELDVVFGILQKVLTIMQKRYATFRKSGVRDIQSYNKKYTKDKMKYIVVAIDEYSILMEDKDSQRKLQILSALSRGAGISLIISTQRPDSQVIDSRIKCNFSVIAGLRTNTDINSRIIIDDESLSKLRGKGHCIFRYGGYDHEVQGMFICDSEIEQLIKSFTIDKSKVVEFTNKEDNNIIDVDFSEMEVFL